VLVASRDRCNILHVRTVPPTSPAAGDIVAIAGRAVRGRRDARGWSRRRLAEASGVSERFLAQLEAGTGNISLARFAEVAAALGATPAELLAEVPTPSAARPIALLGVRGAGKSTLGAALAKKLRVPLVELDQRIEAAAGLPLGEIFALHGEAYYRRLEREVLRQLVSPPTPMVLATGGSIVSDAATYALLRATCRTVWLRARPREHWDRVVAQGDSRPMAKNPAAFAELQALLAARASLYGQADHVVDTSGRTPSAVLGELVALT
jgi:XRE family aerobic/anaerobic benzoate catabolism transcriptional regulator